MSITQRPNFEKWFYFILILLAFVLYGNTIFNEYSLDDRLIVTENSYVQNGLAGIDDIFKSNYFQSKDVTLDKRPVSVSTFAIEYQFFGANPHVSHFINVLLYALLLIVLFQTLKRVFKLDTLHYLLPFLVTILYAVHPIHTEVVASLKNRDELLVMLFGLLFLKHGTKVFEESPNKFRNLILSLVFLTIGLLSKINELVYVFLLIALFIFSNNNKKNYLNYVFILLALSITFIAFFDIYADYNRQISVYENPLVLTKDINLFIGTIFNVLAYHIKMLLIPYPLRFYYGYNMFPVIGINAIIPLLSFLFHVGLLAYGLYKFFKKEIIGLFIVCYFISIALYVNYPILYTGLFSERALFLSSLWFIVILLSILMQPKILHRNIKRNNLILNKKSAILFSGIMLIFSYSTIQRNFYWKDELSLLSHDITTMENSVIGNYIYANILKDYSKKASSKEEAEMYGNEALIYYNRCMELAPEYPEIYFKIGSTYRYNLQNMDSAKLYFRYAVTIDSLYRHANFELAKLLFDTRDFKNSYKYFQRTHQLTPTDSLTLFYYGQCATYVNEMDTAFKINNEFIQLYPNLPYPYLNMGIYYSTNLKDDSAIVYLEKAVQLGYKESGLVAQISDFYKQKGNTEKARYYSLLNK